MKNTKEVLKDARLFLKYGDGKERDITEGFFKYFPKAIVVQVEYSGMDLTAEEIQEALFKSEVNLDPLRAIQRVKLINNLNK